MVECLIPLFGGSDADLKIFLDLVLPDKVFQTARPETGFQGGFFAT
jgi:hypothetical protein